MSGTTRSDDGPNDLDAVHTVRGPEQSVAAAVVDLYTTIVDCDPTDLPPLYDTVDPDALEALVSDRDADVEVTFTYAGLSVSVSGDGTVALRERVPAAESS